MCTFSYCHLISLTVKKYSDRIHIFHAYEILIHKTSTKWGEISTRKHWASVFFALDSIFTILSRMNSNHTLSALCISNKFILFAETHCQYRIDYDVLNPNISHLLHALIQQQKKWENQRNNLTRYYFNPVSNGCVSNTMAWSVFHFDETSTTDAIFNVLFPRLFCTKYISIYFHLSNWFARAFC